jgi:hypothetical protein
MKTQNTDRISLFLAELSKPGVVRPSKSNARHLIRRTCFNLPKLSSITTAQSSSSVHQPISPTSQLHPLVDTSFSAPLSNRKANPHDQLSFSTSQSKEAPSRGISPRINHNTPTHNIYNPSSIEKI